MRALVAISILLVWGFGGSYLRIRYARLYGGDSPFKAMVWGYLWGGPREGRPLQRFIYVWAIFWPALLVVLGLTVFQERH